MDTRPTDDLTDFPRILKQPGGGRLKVANTAELEAAVADGWALHVAPEPHAPAAAQLLNPPIHDAPAAPTLAPAHQDADALAGGLDDIETTVAALGDLRTVQNLRLLEARGRNRKRVLAVIDARIGALAKKK